MKSDQGLPFASTSTSSSSTSTLPQDSGRQLLLPHPPGLNIYQPFHNRLKIRDSQSEYTLDELLVLWCDDAKKESFRNHLVADMYHSDSDSDADIDNTVIYGGMGVRDVDDAELLGEQDLFQETWRVYSSLQQQHEERTSDVLRRNHLLSVMYWSAHLDFLSRKHDSVNVTGSGFSTSGDDQEAPKLIPITTTQRQPHVNKISSTTQVSYTIPYNDGVVSNINKIAFRRDFQSLERHQYESARKKKKRKMNSSDPQSALSGPSPMKDYSKIYFYGCYNPMKNENFQKMKIETILPRSTFNRSSTSSSSTLSMSLGFRFSQTRTHIATIKNLLIPCTLPLPNCMAWNKIVRNKRTDDDPVLRYIPYFGEWDTTGMDVSAWDLLPGQCEPEVSREIDELLIVYMVQKSGGVIEKDYSSKFMIRNRVIQSVLCEFLQCSRKELKKCYKKVIDGIFLRIRDKEKHNARIDSDDDKSKESRQIVHLNGLSALSTLLDTPDNISFKNDDVFDMEVGLGLRCGRSYNDLSQNFRYFFCRRCFVYNCQDHLERNHPMPFNRKDPPSLSTPPFSRKNVNTIRYKLDHVNRFDEIRSGQDGNKVRTRVTSDSLYTTPTINDHTKKIEHAKKNAFLDIFLKQTLCVNTNETLLSLLHPGKEVEALQYFCKEKKRANHDTRLQRDGNNPSRIPYALYHCKQTDQNTTVLPSSTLSPSPIIKNITYKLAGRSRHWTSSSGAVRVQTMKPKADEEYRMSQTEHTLLTKLDEIFSKHKYNDNNNNSSKYDSSKNDVGKTYSCGDNKLNMSSNSPSRVKKRSRYERIAHVLGTQRPDVVETYLTNVHVRPTDDKSDTDDKDVILCEEISTEIFDQASIRHLTQMQRATGFYKEFRPCSHDGPCGPGGSPEWYYPYLLLMIINAFLIIA